MTYHHAAANKLRSWLLGDWVNNGPTVCILQGLSGVGKTRLAAEVCRSWHGPSIIVTATDANLGLEDLLFEIAAAFEAEGIPEMADAADLEDGLRAQLEVGALIVITNFDATLNRETRLPHKTVMRFLSAVSRQKFSGRILLVGSQRVGEGPWSTEIAFRYLNPPAEEEAVSFLNGLLVDRALDQEVPLEKRGDVVRWLGNNPRAIHTLVICLADEPLDVLIELEPEAWSLRDDVVSPELLRRLEEAFMARTLGRLDANATLMAEYLSVYRRPFQTDAMQRLVSVVADINAGRNALSNRFLLYQTAPGWYAIHPVVKHLAKNRIALDPRQKRAAHSRAADHYGRHFRAVGEAPLRLTKFGDAFVEVRFHLIHAGRDTEFESIASRYRGQLTSHYKNVASVVKGSGEAKTLLVVLLAALMHDDPGYSRLRSILAHLLVDRDAPGDRVLAFRQVTLATKDAKDVWTWILRIRLAWEIDGYLSANEAAKQAANVVAKAVVWRIYHLHASCLFEHQRIRDALQFLEEGVQKAHRDNLFGLYSLGAYILSAANRRSDALELLMAGYVELGPSGKYRWRLSEQALFIAYGWRNIDKILKIQSHLVADGSPDQLALSNALVLAIRGRYRDAAHLLGQQEMSPVMAGQAAFFWLCAGKVSEAASVVAFCNSVNNAATRWIRALVARCEKKEEVYREELRLSLERDLTDDEMSNPHLWFDIWLQTPTAQRIFPAFYFPRLPESLTGLDEDLVHADLPGDMIGSDLKEKIKLPQGVHVDVPLDQTAQVAIGNYWEFNMVTENNENKWNVQAGQIGVVGDNATAIGNNFVQGETASHGDQGLDELLAELEKLRKAMKDRAQTAEEDIAVSEIAHAEVAAKAGDKNATVSHLGKAGKWAFSVATAVGTSLAAAIIKTQLGL